MSCGKFKTWFFGPNLWIEDCSEENLDWKMAEVPSKAWKKVYP